MTHTWGGGEDCEKSKMSYLKDKDFKTSIISMLKENHV